MARDPNCWGPESVQADEDLTTPAQVALAEARSTPSRSAYALFIVAIAVLLTPPLTLTAARSAALPGI
jgi:hypothetical protein